MSPVVDDLSTRLSDLGLFDQAALRDFLSSLPESEQPTDAEGFLQALVRGRRLTAYQARQIGAGQGQSLVLGNYVILDKLGQGGMGEVFKAQHLRMQRVVALKLLSAQITRDPATLKRFQREVVAAARLVHPNIVTAYDADEAKDTHFLIMEHVAGRDLARLVRETGTLSVPQAVRCTLQAARGLEFAHEHGVVHRDVKPSNLLLEAGGAVKVLDLGLARLDSIAGPQDELTWTGDIMGTVDYMAPEQAENSKLADARSDIYSLGMSLWFLLTGRPAYERESLAAKIIAHRTAPIPSLAEARPDAAAELNEIFHKLVAKDPRQRYQTMAEVIAALQNHVASLGDATQALNDASEFTVRLASISQREDDTVVFVKPAAGSTNRLEMLEPTLQATPRGPTQQPPTERSRAPWALALAFVGGAAMILLTVFLLLPRRNGDVVIDVTDSAVEMTIDQGKVKIVGITTKKLSLAAGKHDLAVKRGDTELTEQFVVAQGKPTTLQVEVVDGVLQVKQDGKVLGSVALVPPGGQNAPPVANVRHTLEFAPGTKVEIASLKLNRDGALTLEAYVRPGEFAAGKPGVLLGTPLQFALHLDPQTNRLSLESYHADGEHHVGPIQLAPDRRLHVAAVRATNEHRLYVEGILVGREKIASPLLESAAPFTIGGQFTGTVEEVRISKVERYEQRFTPAESFEPDTNTLALYHVTDSRGELLSDASGNNHAGQIIGARWVEMEIPPATIPIVRPDLALSFSGEGGMVHIPSLKMEQDGPITIECWARPRGLGFPHYAFGLGGRLVLKLISKPKDGTSRWELICPGEEPQTYYMVGSPWFSEPAARPVHVAGVFDGQTLKIYVDGKRQPGRLQQNVAGGPPQEPIKIGNVNSKSPSGIGANRGKSGPFWTFDGELDEIRISQSARYDEDFTPQRRFEPDLDTLALYHCDEGSGDVLHDQSSHGHHGQIVGVNWVRADYMERDLGRLTRDLLQGLDPATDGLVHDKADDTWKAGDWKFSPQGLRSGNGRHEIYRLPVESLPPSYSLRIDFEADEGLGALLVPLIAGTKPCYLILNGDLKNEKRQAGFGEIDGQGSHRNETTAVHGPCNLHERHFVQIDVKTIGDESELIAQLDGRPLTKFKGKTERLGVVGFQNSYDAQSPRLSIGSMQGNYLFHRVELRTQTPVTLSGAARDREIAAWVLSRGGRVGIQHMLPERWQVVNPGELLPREAFLLRQILLTDIKDVASADLARLVGADRLVGLFLENTGIDGDAATHIAKLPCLRALTVGGSKWPSSSFSELAGLRNLNYVYLGADQVDDQFAFCEKLPRLRKITLTGDGALDLPRLSGYANLREIHFPGRDAVDEASAAFLREKNPLCRIVVGNSDRAKSFGFDPLVDQMRPLVKRGVLIRGAPYRFTATVILTDELLSSGQAYTIDSVEVPDEVLLTDEEREQLINSASMVFGIFAARQPRADELAGRLAENTNLTLVRLTDCDLSDAGLTKLHGLVGLHELKVTKTQVTRAGIDAFREAAPGCHVISDFGTFPARFKQSPVPAATAR